MKRNHDLKWFPFFSCLLVTIQYCSDIVWSKDLSVYLFCFLPIFDREFFFLFCFLPMSNRELSFSFVFFRSLIENFLFFLLFLKRVSSSIVSDSSFLGDPTIPSSEGTDGNSRSRIGRKQKKKKVPG